MNRSISLPRPAGRHGLTIIKLLIGVAIIAVLATAAVPQYMGYLKKTERKQAVADIRMLEGVIGRYRTEMGALPDNLGAAIDPVPSDPWGNPYQYIRIQGVDKVTCRKDKNLHPLNSDYDLYSIGADGNSVMPLTAKASHDDIIRANDGAFVGLAEEY